MCLEAVLLVPTNSAECTAAEYKASKSFIGVCGDQATMPEVPLSRRWHGAAVGA